MPQQPDQVPPKDPRRDAFVAHQLASEGAALSYLRKRFLPLKDQPAAAERWFDEAPRVLLMPSELRKSKLGPDRIKTLSAALARLGDPAVRDALIAAVSDTRALAKIATRIGLQPDHLNLLTAMTAAASARGVVAQATPCGAECPYCHGWTCVGAGACTLGSSHGGAHKCSVNHRWR